MPEIPDPNYTGPRVLPHYIGDGCTSCGEGSPLNECPKAQRRCGHHCNHSWIDRCCWCGAEFDQDDLELTL